MKKLYLFVLSIVVFSACFANPVITAVKSGSWSSVSSWNKNRLPADLDTIVIPAGKKISFDNVLSSVTLKGVYIKIFGTLQLSGFLSSLNLDNKSTIVVYSGGSVTSNSIWQTISIAGQPVFATPTASVFGPQMATASSGGFSAFNPLPVKFVSFTLSRKNSDILLHWSTAQEINVNLYEVERSTDGSSWTTVAYVMAEGSSNENNYSYTDKNLTPGIAYYRIKEVDVDGRTTFTSIQSIRFDPVSTTPGILIAAAENKVILQFAEQVKGNLLVRFVSLSGQVMEQQIISNAVGQVVLHSKLKGNYIISLSNGEGIHTAKQVML